MIHIREQQFDRFEKQSQLNFENELADHLHQFSPKHIKGIGEQGLNKLIATGLTKAKSFGWKRRGSLRFFLECQVMFGHCFFNDPILPWVSQFFENQNKISMNDLTMADQAHAEAMKYRAKVVGENEKIEATAIKKLISKPVKEWLSGDLSITETQKILMDVYPEKISNAPANGLSALIQKSQNRATLEKLPRTFTLPFTKLQKIRCRTQFEFPQQPTDRFTNHEKTFFTFRKTQWFSLRHQWTKNFIQRRTQCPNSFSGGHPCNCFWILL